MFKDTHLRNKLSSTPSGLTPDHDQRHQENVLPKYQPHDEASSFTTLYHPSSYNPPQYQHSPQRYNSANQFYNTIHPSAISFSTSNETGGGGGGGGSKRYNNVYNMKTASVYPNNLYNNISSVTSLGSSTSTDHDGSGSKLSLTVYENPRHGRESEV